MVVSQAKFAVIGDYGNDDELLVSNLVISWNVDFIITSRDISYSNTMIDDNLGK